MPSKSRKIPAYRLHKPTGQAVVRLDGRDHYLGKHGTETSREKYRRIVGEWLTCGTAVRPSPGEGAEGHGLTVGELLLAYWRHAEVHYRTVDGRPARELDNLRDALRPLHQLYGQTPATTFGPLALRAVREEMIRSGLARTTVNWRINRVRRLFKWAVGVELVPPAVSQALAAVEGLRQGRTEAREAAAVMPVPVEDVEATLPHLPAPVAAMVRLQLLTGMRAGEVMRMRGCELTPGEPNWEYRPSTHKNSWRGRGRVIPLGRQAQAIVREFLGPDPTANLFSPRDSVRRRQGRRRDARRTRPTPSELARRSGDPGGSHAPCYDRRTYRQAIVRACRKAGVAEWSPLQLRHATGTMIRARYGLEAAQTVLGHARADVTQVYAERDLAKAHAIMAEIG